MATQGVVTRVRVTESWASCLSGKEGLTKFPELPVE